MAKQETNPNHHGAYSIDGRRHLYHFASIGDYADHVARLHRNKVWWPNTDKSSQKSHSRDWCADSFGGALQRCLDGGFWPEGAESLATVDVRELAAEMSPLTDIAIELGVAGGAVDVGEYLAGGEECFYQAQEVEENKPIVRIGFMAVCSAAVKAKQMLCRGRGLLALVECFELRGYSVELTAVDSFDNGGSMTYGETHTTIKAAGEPWSAATVAYPMAHTGWSRRLGFRFLEGSTAGEPSNSNGYGGGYTLEHWHSEGVDERQGFDLAFRYVLKGCDYGDDTQAVENILKEAKESNPELMKNAGI